jgi:hypothetical protein
MVGKDRGTVAPFLRKLLKINVSLRSKKFSGASEKVSLRSEKLSL